MLRGAPKVGVDKSTEHFIKCFAYFNFKFNFSPDLFPSKVGFYFDFIFLWESNTFYLKVIERGDFLYLSLDLFCSKSAKFTVDYFYFLFRRKEGTWKVYGAIFCESFAYLFA